MTCSQWDVVVVPFPFTDRQAVKRRPALVLSDPREFDIGHSVLAMITSQHNAAWPLDVSITGKRAAGLAAPSVVRMKLFTLDHRLILRRAGRLSEKDVSAVRRSLRALFGRLPS
ncbi:MAG TPA: type II toxin-antitoxin system PemK/MazF family toxin [Gammaproteobacteria bacterium]|nr:type II toxin-antitoxin system PemK/MazF family toxin [Gammaproteobacteria bacterium]